MPCHTPAAAAALLSPGADIIKEGDTDAERFFVLEEGECHVFKSVRDPAADPSAPPATKLVKTYKAGSAFGELALLYSAPRAATVVATQPCKLWVMERATYNAVRRNFLQVSSPQITTKPPNHYHGFPFHPQPRA